MRLGTPDFFRCWFLLDAGATMQRFSNLNSIELFLRLCTVNRLMPKRHALRDLDTGKK